MASFDEAILPGKVGKVTAKLNTESYRGPVEKAITVTSSDSANASVTLRLKANVVGSIEILPQAYVSFPKPPLMEYSTKLLIRKDKSETGELKISDLTTAAPWLVAKTRKVESPEPASDGFPAAAPGDWILDLQVSDDAPMGSTGQQVRFSTGLTREPTVNLPISVFLHQAMQAIPPSLVMVAPAGVNEFKGTFTVTLRPGLGSEPPKATASSSSFDVSLAREADRRYKATVVWKSKADAPEKDGTILLSVKDETLKVPVRLIEKPAVTSSGRPGIAGAQPGPGAPPAPPEPTP